MRMSWLDQTLAAPEENLALDEALLHRSEGGPAGGVLRFWEPRRPFVVLGYGNRFESETHFPLCRKKGIPVLRRVSGGGAVLQASGCLNFSLVLPIRADGPCRSIASTNRFVLERHRKALERLLRRPVGHQGDTDLTLGDRKFSGNSQRRLKTHLLFHGTFLLRMDLALVEKFLPIPARQPGYRSGRKHRQFLVNLDLPAQHVKEALRSAWNAEQPLRPFPPDELSDLVSRRYSNDDWNFRR